MPRAPAAKSTDPLACPFVVLVDDREQMPYAFAGLHADSAQKYRPLVITTERRRLTDMHGDYQIKGLEDIASIERKSIEDAQGTILGFGEGRRERFEIELANLAAMEAAAVVVEGEFGELICDAPETPRKTAAQNAKTLYRTVLAWQQDFRVPWIFCSSRRNAEETCFRLLERFWRKRNE